MNKFHKITLHVVVEVEGKKSEVKLLATLPAPAVSPVDVTAFLSSVRWQFDSLMHSFHDAMNVKEAEKG